MLKVLDLFAGIGGFSLGLERTGGFETVAFCEIEPYAQKVLAKHWPGVPIYDDVRELTADRLASDGIAVDVITGGFPCQDISVAGKQAGIQGERSGLWSECARLLGELRPRYAIFENVTALLSGERGDWFKRVLWDISQIGFNVEWHCIPASEFGAHHHRDRVWIIAHDEKLYRDGRVIDDQDCQAQTQKPRSRSGSNAANTHRQGLQKRQLLARIPRKVTGHEQGEAAPLYGRRFARPGVVRGVHGIPRRVDRLRCLGNAVVPQIPEMIGRAILDRESLLRAEDELVNLMVEIN